MWDGPEGRAETCRWIFFFLWRTTQAGGAVTLPSTVDVVSRRRRKRRPSSGQIGYVQVADVAQD